MATIKKRQAKPLAVAFDSPKKKPDNKKVLELKMDRIVEAMNDKYGVNSIMRGFPKFEGDPDSDWYNVRRFSTGVPSLDIALGGGIPVGRYVEFQGPESSYKTTIGIHAMREFQKKFGKVVFLADAEGTSTQDGGQYLRDLGIEEGLFMCNPSFGLEESTQMILDLMDDEDVRLAMIDSIESLEPVKEYKSRMEKEVQMGVKQKLLGEFFRKFAAKNNRIVREGGMPFTIIGINQLREKIGVMFGDPEYAPGGRSKDYYQSIRVRYRRGDVIQEGTGDNKIAVGRVIKFKVSKNKTYPSGKDGEFNMYSAPNSAGVTPGFCDAPESVILESVRMGLIVRAGAYYSLRDDPEVKFKGVEAISQYLKDNPERIDALSEAVLAEVRKG